MWIKTEKGSLLNLDSVSIIYFDGKDTRATLTGEEGAFAIVANRDIVNAIGEHLGYCVPSFGLLNASEL